MSKSLSPPARWVNSNFFKGMLILVSNTATVGLWEFLCCLVCYHESCRGYAVFRAQLWRLCGSNAAVTVLWCVQPAVMLWCCWWIRAMQTFSTSSTVFSIFCLLPGTQHTLQLFADTQHFPLPWQKLNNLAWYLMALKQNCKKSLILSVTFSRTQKWLWFLSSSHPTK